MTYDACIDQKPPQTSLDLQLKHFFRLHAIQTAFKDLDALLNQEHSSFLKKSEESEIPLNRTVQQGSSTMSLAFESPLNQSGFPEDPLYVIEEQTDNFTSFRGDFEKKFEEVLAGRSRAKGFYDLMVEYQKKSVRSIRQEGPFGPLFVLI